VGRGRWGITEPRETRRGRRSREKKKKAFVARKGNRRKFTGSRSAFWPKAGGSKERVDLIPKVWSDLIGVHRRVIEPWESRSRDGGPGHGRRQDDSELERGLSTTRRRFRLDDIV
jgi:hypothetical protein